MTHATKIKGLMILGEKQGYIINVRYDTDSYHEYSIFINKPDEDKLTGVMYYSYYWFDHLSIKSILKDMISCYND